MPEHAYLIFLTATLLQC